MTFLLLSSFPHTTLPKNIYGLKFFICYFPRFSLNNSLILKLTNQRENMAKKPSLIFNESGLNKGQMRKLTALRKSLGEDIADKAFGEWIEKQGKQPDSAPVDANAAIIADTLEPLTQSGKLRFPRGGYLVRRGRGRVIVERVRP